MKALVSICNKQQAANLDDPNGFLYRIDLSEESAPQPVYLKHPALKGVEGVTGIIRYGNGYAAVTQSDTPQLMFLDNGLNVTDVINLALVLDAHTILEKDGSLYIASTGNDSIVRFDPRNGEDLYWRANEKNKDTIHLNAILAHEGRMLATAFGRKKDKFWRTATDGFILDVESGQTVMAGLYHPHSLIAFEGRIYLCESFRMALRGTDGQIFETGGGYTRGLAMTEHVILAGFSRGRKYSRSTGEALGQVPDSPDLSVHPCRVAAYRWKKGDLATCTPDRIISFGNRAREIYDILLIED